jgi:hypothetical protein
MRVLSVSRWRWAPPALPWRALDRSASSRRRRLSIRYLEKVIAGMRLAVGAAGGRDATDLGRRRRATGLRREGAPIRTSGASVWASGAILDTVSLERFRNGLETIYERLEGSAELGTDEPDLAVRVANAGHGGLTVTVQITPDHMNQEHEFRFDLDQTYLPRVIGALREALERYPIRGREKSVPDAR